MQYCDTFIDGGGWLVIQRRKDGSETIFIDFGGNMKWGLVASQVSFGLD